MANKRQIVFEFREVLYDHLIPRFGEDFAMKDVLYELSSMGLIPPKTLRNYMMIHDFDKFIIQNKGHVGNTFIDISVKYEISEKQAKNIVYKQRKKFEPKTNIL
ncbi:MAG: hypothetical protein GOVbin5978_40 [Prokaryotic dsDNA virus sp.]|nr:MAG: hypothetical protein GOVbin5978_40 [Prokaryotic dsDNA virus sp.]|tara:strand:- start:3332 stop:3643 length:312 start_codon:yes stop_codon:yes gene_type:complete